MSFVSSLFLSVVPYFNLKQPEKELNNLEFCGRRGEGEEKSVIFLERRFYFEAHCCGDREA
jgi:hypothetical protein